MSILWPELFNRYRVKISFAYQTFAWESEARGKAHVHVVIIAFADRDTENKLVFGMPDSDGAITITQVENISPYLVRGLDKALPIKPTAWPGVPAMLWGSKPSDGGHLILSQAEKEHLLREEPAAAQWIRPYCGASEFLNGELRWCLWLKAISPTQLAQLPAVRSRVDKCATCVYKVGGGNSSTGANTDSFCARCATQ